MHTGRSIFTLFLLALPLSVSAAGGIPSPRLTDHLRGNTLGQPSEGAVRPSSSGLTIAAWNGWVRYAHPSSELPRAAATIAVSLRVDDDFQEGVLLSDAYARTSLGTPGTTWPSLQVKAIRTGPALFRMAFGYCSAPQPVTGARWHFVESPPLPTGQWLDVGISWGPHGQLLWLGDRICASSPYSGAYAIDPSTPLFRGWGLGCVYNSLTPDSLDPAPERSAYAVSYRNLRLWDGQVWLGPLGKQQ